MDEPSDIAVPDVSVPDVSLIVPAYNRVHVLHRSVLSILSQRGLRVELIVVDDCSTDDTWQHLEMIRRENPGAMIRLLRLEKNAAQATARNRGLEIATGAYVAFLDTDDALADHDILADMLRMARAQDLDMLIAPFLYFDGVALTEVSRLDLAGGVTDALQSPEVVDSRSHWHVLYSRAFLDRVPLRFAETIRHREDRPFLTGALLNARRIGAFSRPMVHYFRDMADSVMNNPTLREFGFYLEHLREVNRWVDLARAEGRLNPEFERLNAVLYACSHLHYWAPAWLELIAGESPGMRAMLAAFDTELDRLFRPAGVLFPLDDAWPCHPIIRDAGRELVSGRVDLLRHAILTRDHDLTRALLSGPDLPLSWLYRMKGQGDEAERIAQRALAFAGRREGIPGRVGQDRAPGRIVPRILLHVGGMKTGSSALQNWLEDNRFALLDQGFHYPAIGTWREDGVRSNRNSGHDALIWGLLQDGKAAGMRFALMAEIAALPHPPQVLILSLETILSPRFAEDGIDFARIAQAIGGQIEVIWLERASGPWLASIHRERICNPRNGYLGTLEEVTAAYRALGLLDGARITAMLETPPEVAAVHHARYEDLRPTMAKDGGTIGYFCKIAGIDMRGLRGGGPRDANLSFTAGQAAQILALKQDATLTALQQDEAFRVITRGGDPDLQEIRRKHPEPRRLPGRLAHLAGLNRQAGPHRAIRLFALPPDLQLLVLPEGVRQVRLQGETGLSHDLTPVIWNGESVLPLDSRLVAGLGKTCTIGISGPTLTPQGMDFGILPDPEAGFLRLVPKAGACPEPPPHLLWRKRDAPPDGRSEAVVIGAKTPAEAEAWLLSQPEFSTAGRMSPWRRAGRGPGPVALSGQADWRDYFDAEFYLAGNPDVARAGIDPARHFHAQGAAEGRLPAPGFPAAFLRGTEAGADFAAMVAASQRWLLPRTSGAEATPAPAEKPPSRTGRVASGIALDFYRAQVPGAKFPNARAAAKHYLQQGHAQGLDPAPWFSETLYLRDHPDVARAALPGFAHYLMHGAQEGRRVQPSARAGRTGGAIRPVALDLLRLHPQLEAAFGRQRARLLVLGPPPPGAETLPEGVLWLPADGLPPGDCTPAGLATVLLAIAAMTGAGALLGVGGPQFSAALQGGLADGGVPVEGWFPGDLPLSDLPLLPRLRRIHLPPGRFEQAVVNWNEGLPPLMAADLPTAIRAAIRAAPQP